MLKIADFAKIGPLTPAIWANIDLGSKIHNQSQVLVESNPLFFSAKIYDP